MSLVDILCKLPPPPPAGCCGSAPKPPSAPVTVFNPPGLTHIGYRVGTFTTFRRAMLDEIARPDLLADVVNPFAGWREGADSDYQTMFVELWAYLADVLTFYQELIANEAFLPTAAQRDSLFRLAELIDYRPAPGAGASGFVNFVVEKNKTVIVPAGFRVGSKAQPATDLAAAKAAAVFETGKGITALGEHSSIALSPVAPTDQFAKLASFSLFGGLSAGPAVAATDLYGNAGAIYLNAFPQQLAVIAAAASSGPELSASASVLESASVSATPLVSAISGNVDFVDSASTPQISSSSGIGTFELQPASVAATFGTGFVAQVIEPGFTFVPLFPYFPFVNQSTRTIVLKGINNRLAIGDYLVAVENEGDATAEKASLRKITSVTTDKAGDVTTIRWSEPENSVYDRSKSPVVVYALRVKAGAFGNTAPAFNTLPLTLTGTVNDVDGPLLGKNWDDSTSSHFFVPHPDDPAKNQIFLDAVYDDIKAAPEKPGWAAFIGDNNANQVVHVTEARPVSKAAYAVTNKVTRLTLKENITARAFPLRTTLIVAASEPLELQNNLPLPDPVAGDLLILSGVHAQLQAGQTIVVQGVVFDSGSAALVNAELRSLRDAPVTDSGNNITTVILDKPLDKQYVRAGTSVLGNVVPVSQGETVRDEKIGSSDGSANQSFRLKKPPLTYLPSTDAEGIAAVASTLIVTVNGVRWQELRSVLESAPNDEVFTARQDAAGETTITFGDGFNGARPPTGKDNIRGQYRKGLGTSGNLSPGGIQQLLDNVTGLQRVANPVATGGGAEPDDIGQIRRNAPGSVRAFGRAVSVLDYSALALTFPSVVKANAAYITRDANLVALPHPFVQLTVATGNRLPLSEQPAFSAQLRSFLDARRDPNVPLRIVDFTRIFLDVALTVDIDDRFPQQATLASVRAALNPAPNPDGTLGFFSFDRLGFGQSVSLSGVYAAAQGVPGVADVNVTTFRRMDLDAGQPGTIRDDIFVRPTEIVVIDTDPAASEQGVLAVNLGKGGFADQ